MEWWGLQNHYHVQPNNCVEVVLRCVVVGVVTIDHSRGSPSHGASYLIFMFLESLEHVEWENTQSYFQFQLLIFSPRGYATLGDVANR